MTKSRQMAADYLTRESNRILNGQNDDGGRVNNGNNGQDGLNQEVVVLDNNDHAVHGNGDQKVNNEDFPENGNALDHIRGEAGGINENIQNAGNNNRSRLTISRTTID